MTSNFKDLLAALQDANVIRVERKVERCDNVLRLVINPKYGEHDIRFYHESKTDIIDLPNVEIDTRTICGDFFSRADVILKGADQ